MKSTTFALLAALIFVSCNDSKITNDRDYNKYLAVADQNNSLSNSQTLEFWNMRIKKDSTQLIALAKSAQANSAIFKHTADIQHLKNAEELLLKATSIAAIEKDSYLQALAHNYITQHRFKEAKELLEKAYQVGGETNDIHLMLFDVTLELGDYTAAENHLAKTEDFADFNYLTRLAKWKDHIGDLDATIHYMEKALEIAENTNKKEIKVWTYTNLGDYYGHAGRIKDSYEFYLKALEIEPSNAYAKKGIAWIAYSHEKNAQEALRIIDAIDDYNHGPDYHLLKAEIAAYTQNPDLQKEEIKAYIKAASNERYGLMYNSYTSQVLAEENSEFSQALDLVLREVAQRPTPQSYDLLAYVYYLKGDYKKALEIADTYVINNTYEPLALLHTAKIYKANNLNTKATDLKKELLEATYELGPVASIEIEDL